MSYIPDVVTPEYSRLSDRKDFSRVKMLWYPEHKKQIARLSLEEKQVWMAAQDPQLLIDFGNDEGFSQFWFWHYLLPLKLKRVMYWFKFW